MEINGLPLHPLVVHAVVVLVPLGALVAGLFALVPRWRWLLRWPTLLLGIAGAVLVQVAVVSGHDLEHTRGLGGTAIETHEMWGDRLRIAVFVLAAVAVVASWLLPPRVQRWSLRPSRADSGGAAALETPVVVLLVLAALVVLVLAFLTGEAGARAVWGTA